MTPDAVFAELAGLRALARSLVHGDADADDLLQDAALATLEHPPVLDDRPVGGWLRTIVRNRWRMDRRGASRRQAREQAIIVEDRNLGDATGDAIDRARDLERLAQALVALDEPFRTVVVRRFLDGESAAQIAQTLGIPAGTVRWRLKTGLARLRAALDGERGSEPHAEPARPSRWQPLLAPLIGASVKTKTAVVLIVLILLFGVIALWRLHGGSPPPPVLTASAAHPTVHGPAPPTPTLTRPAAAPRATVVTSDAPGGVLAGRVVHGLTREAVAGAEVTFLGSAGATTLLTDDDGGFALAPPAPGSFVLASVAAPGFLPYASAPDVAPVRATLAPGHDVRGIQLILWPAIDYLGTVIDRHDKPVAGAQIRVIGTQIGERLPDGAASEWTSDADGHFTFQAAPWALVEAKRGASAGRATLTLALAARKQLMIQLREDNWLVESITGHVRTAAGAPVADAQVVATPDPRFLQPMAYATTGDDGSFTLAGLDRGAYRLSAEDSGHARAMLAGVTGGSKDVTLTVDAGLLLTGRVVDPTGGPVPMFNLVVSRPGRPDDVAIARSLADPDGRFALRVAPGDYELMVSAAGWASPAPTAIAAGASLVTIALQVGAKLRGVVIAGDTRAPIVHARVRRAGVSGGSSVQPINPWAVTGDDGSFEVTGIPAGPVTLRIEAEGYHTRIEATTSAIDGGALGPITLELARIADGEMLALEQVGIGVVLAPDDGAPLVTNLKRGSSAAAAGVRVGDHIAAIDGTPTATLDMRSVVNKISGPAGTTVALSILRDGHTLDLAIPRRTFRTGL